MWNVAKEKESGAKCRQRTWAPSLILRGKRTETLPHRNVPIETLEISDIIRHAFPAG